MSRAWDAEHHQLHHISGRCSAAFHPPEVDNALTHGVEGTSEVPPHTQGTWFAGLEHPWPVEKDASQTTVLLSLWPSPVGSAAQGWCFPTKAVVQQSHSPLDSIPSWINPGRPVWLSQDFSMVSSLMCNYKAMKYLCECLMPSPRLC